MKRKCKHDKQFKKGRIPWNKGKKGLQTSWLKGKKGYKPKHSIEEYNKNNPPWNKGLRGIQRGKNAPNWKGGLTKLSVAIRGQIDIIKLMAKRKKIDDYTCQICGKRGGDLETDHFPVSFAEIIKKYNITNIEEALSCKKMLDIENLRTLCKSCHRKTKSFGRPRKRKNDAREAVKGGK
jgi:hypothetical protein